jgi:Mn2+/Fe2+ NRAMP family transporter
MANRKKNQIEPKGKGLLSRFGPGLITGASDDDPSGIGTYSQAGAQIGFGIGWTMLLSYPLMVAIQEISARIGRVTGHGIAGNVCRNFPSPAIWSLILLLFVGLRWVSYMFLGLKRCAVSLFQKSHSAHSF